MDINGETHIIVFFGSTYKTSKMYAMYNAAFKALKMNYVYVPGVVNDLAKAVDGVRHLGIKAIGVTVPYKVSIIPYLDSLDEHAKRIGSVNAIINENGTLIGKNTDGDGCVRALEEVTVLKNKRVLLIGAGGAGRAIAFAVADKKAHLTIVNRTAETAKELAGQVECDWNSLENLEKAVSESDIIINATTVGMAPDIEKSPVPKQLLNKNQVIMDLISNPKETKLLQGARETGCKVVYGHRMLLWQGVLKFKLYTGVEPPIKEMEKVFV